MALNAVDGPMLAIKKLGGLMFILAGFLGIVIGLETGSTGLIATGIVALAVGVTLIVLKIRRRNAGW
jgi:hypothetical protein